MLKICYKKTFSLILGLFIFSGIFAQDNNLRIRFIKGNISEKTVAVREASGIESIWLSTQAISFALENKELLGNDRELDALAVAAVLSISPELIESSTEAQKQYFLDQFINLFTRFEQSNTVQIAVISKILLLRNSFNTTKFTEVLNDYLGKVDSSNVDKGTLKSVINSLEYLGNKNSFIVLYSLWNNEAYAEFNPEIEQSLAKLIKVSMNEVLYIIKSKNLTNIQSIWDLIIKKSDISKNNLCEVAENLLFVTNILMENSLNQKEMDKAKIESIISVQLNALDILSTNNWTRASEVAIDLFENTKTGYTSRVLNENDFIPVIKALNTIAPIASIKPLTSYLEELNSSKEKGNYVSVNTITTVINTLGAIGDKSAFDSLLAVTYLNDYPESVKSAAREALAGLKW